jgi:putative PIG3 family NAD(P)H quinone oxidoreductase
MRAVVLEDHGDLDVLTLTEVPDPEPGPEDVQVAITATALNRADILQRMGLYPEPGPAREHEIPGMEFSGTVTACGSRVSLWREGDSVMGIVTGGGYADLVVTHERMLLPVPQSVPLADAAAIPEVWITAFDALVAQGGLTSGRTALVHAGASGVGTAAIQIATAIGAEIIVTASTAKVDACRELGAGTVVDYTSEDFVAIAHEVTLGRGVDVVLDVIGGDYLDRNVAAVATRGRIIQVGLMGGGQTPFNLGAMLAKRATLTGTTLRGRPLEEKIAITRRFGFEILPLFDAGSCRTVIDSRYTLESIADAHRRMEANANVGKILVDVVRAG